MSPTFRRLAQLTLLALLAAFVPHARLALANAYTVTSLADSGPGTLRQAIIDANISDGGDTITFAAAGTINLLSPLDSLTGGSITIDGSIPPGGTVPKVEIRGGGLQGPGILIHSSGNTIRGLILNGFVKEPLVGPDYGGAGVIVSGSATNGVASGNTIEYNYIGTNAAGTDIGNSQAENNAMAGVLLIAGASGNTISHNVISGNQGPGIYLTRDRLGADVAVKDANVIRDNIIGLNAAGTAALPNIGDGIFVGNNSQDTVIGPGNVISGNGKGSPQPGSPIYGLKITYDGSINLAQGVFYPKGTLVKGNRIGTDPTGTAALPNRDGGVLVSVSTNTTIGGTSAADSNERNQIAGNNAFGVAIEDYPLAVDGVQRTIGAVVRNNWIGLDAGGAAALPNKSVGVLLRNNIGGARVGPGNVIAGNGDPASHAGGVGVQVLVSSADVDANRAADGNEISDNLIGVTPDGLSFVANQDYGVQLAGETFGNTIKGNRVAGNQSAGVDLRANAGTGGPHDNAVSGNQIGLLAGGGAAGNGPVGLQLTGGSHANTLGPGNTIAGHTGAGAAGLLIDGSGTSDNVVTGNNIINNETGIHVTNSAVGNTITQTTTDNNAGKGILLDNGGNAGIDPSRLSVVAPAQGFTLTGTAAGCAAAPGCTVEIFDSNSALTDEGPHFLKAVPTSGSFSVDIGGCQHYLIFTLTDQTGNTSEFTQPTGNIPQCVGSAPSVTLSDPAPPSPRSVLPGATTFYTHTVANGGTGGGAFTLGITQQSGGWATLNRGDCPADGAQLAAGASCTFNVQVSVPADAPAGAQNATTITAAVGASSATKTDTTIVAQQAGLALTPGAQTQAGAAGQPVSFTHTLANLGSAADSFAITVMTPLSWTYSVAPASPIPLAKNAAISVTVTITPAAGLAPGDYPSTVWASSTADPGVFAQATDTVQIAAGAVAQIASAVTPASVDAGQPVTITYTIANAGNISGTFDLSFTPPPGWSVTGAISPSVTLDPGASATVSTTLQVPAGALAGAYPAKLTATASGGATTTKVDQIVVGARGALELAPASQTTAARPPSAIYTDTVTLKNSGNFTDTVTLAATSSRGWSVRALPASATLGSGATAAISVELTIPPGVAPNIGNTTTITASSSLPNVAPATAQITSTVAAAPGVSLLPSQIEQAIAAGKPITLSFTLQNTGNISQSYTLTTTGVPQGWSSTLTPLDTPSLDPQETASVKLVFQAPAGTPAGTTAEVTIEAQSDQAPFPTARATARVQVGAQVSGELGGACEANALPGAVVPCAHTIANTGLSDATFTLTTTSSLGWENTIAPPSLFVKAGATATFTVTVKVPSSADAGALQKLTVSARSSGAEMAGKVVDAITVLRVTGVSIAPGQTRKPVAKQQVRFVHTLINTGNGPDSFTISATQQRDWGIAISPMQTPILPRGASYSITVLVQAPADMPATAINQIVVRATSDADPRTYDQLVDLLTPDAAGSPEIVWFYQPVVAR